VARSSPQARGSLLVGLQVVCLVLVVLPVGPVLWVTPRWLVVLSLLTLVAAAVLALLGAARLGRGLRAHPAPAAGATLRTDGVYGLVRHPIYLALLLGAAVVTVASGRLLAVLATVALSAVLHVKAGLEEQLLRERFGSDYDEYAQRVPRVLPLPRPPGP
jgi:protein-S-isoprenylcysteine O-methyltransferase Ste14